MSILLTNDDGYDAPGMAALAQALSGIDDLYIAAPSENRSGVGMAITLERELKAERHAPLPGVKIRDSIDGTPSDAVKYGLQHLLRDNPPRLVVSGINHGVNIGRNVRCSGTVGGAFEALVAGVPAMAVSVMYEIPPVWEGAQYYVRLMVEHLPELLKGRTDVMLNLNVPALPPDRIKGLRLARHGIGGYLDTMVPAGGPNRFMLDADWFLPDNREDCDGAVVADDYAVLTPMRFEMTHREMMEELKGSLSGIEGACFEGGE